MRLITFALLVQLAVIDLSFADSNKAHPVKVGVTSILSGDLGILGQNVVDTVETYRKHYLRHNISFVYEDAKLGSTDGLKAYQKLINIDHVDMIIGASSSNGTMAAKSLINSSRTPTVSIVTGGRNIDLAGEFVFRMGNSDTLNGVQEAEAFINAKITNLALLTEETEYTQDIANAFRPKLKELGGKLLFDQSFVPGTSDFRTQIALIKRSGANGILIPTQTGTALGTFVKQWSELGGSRDVPIHTTFVAAPNPDAHTIAGELINGVYYMNPQYNRGSSRLLKFIEDYKKDSGKAPAIPFHTAGTIDTLDLLQQYLDKGETFSKEGFAKFLLTSVKNYDGLMGTYSFDAEGNGNVGFTLDRISGQDAKGME